MPHAKQCNENTSNILKRQENIQNTANAANQCNILTQTPGKHSKQQKKRRTLCNIRNPLIRFKHSTPTNRSDISTIHPYTRIPTNPLSTLRRCRIRKPQKRLHSHHWTQRNRGCKVRRRWWNSRERSSVFSSTGGGGGRRVRIPCWQYGNRLGVLRGILAVEIRELEGMDEHEWWCEGV